jgi:hypothetical protein
MNKTSASAVFVGFELASADDAKTADHTLPLVPPPVKKEEKAALYSSAAASDALPLHAV